MGGSYGGYMTLAAITEYPDLWRAAVDIVGIANFVTFLERTGAYRRKLREAEYGSLEHDRDAARAAVADPPRRPDHGAADGDPRRERPARARAARPSRSWRRSQERGREVVYLRYEDEGHGLVRLANRIDAYPQVAAFLERTLLA